MKELIENAIQAAKIAKEQIEKIRRQFHHPQEEFSIADDAALGAGWAIKRLMDLDAAIQAKSPTQP